MRSRIELFKWNLATLFFNLRIMSEVPTILSKLFDQLSRYKLTYNVTYDYSPQCSSRIVGGDPIKVFSQVPQESFLVIFDLDETLIHVSRDRQGGHVIFIRPLVQMVIHLLQKAGINIGVWTAGIRSHALKSLDFIDPDGHIKYVLHRPHDNHKIPINWSNGKDAYINLKALDLLPGDLQNRTILFDNSIDSIFHASSRSRSILVPNFEPKAGVDEALYLTDRYWLSGLYLILRMYSAFKSCSVDLGDTSEYLLELTKDGLLTKHLRDGMSFIGINDRHFSSIHDVTLQELLQSIGEMTKSLVLKPVRFSEQVKACKPSPESPESPESAESAESAESPECPESLALSLK